jgi:hypothetical protein
MKMNTNELIAHLAAGAMPVRRLPPPSVRTLLWLAVSLPFVAAIVVLMPEKVNLAQAIVDKQFLVEEFAILATALAAAVAAFCSVVPGYDRRIVVLPLVPLAVWLASLGQGCVQDLIRSGASGLQLRPDWECLLPAALMGIIPATAMVVMLRRGAPLLPGVTLALGALAVAALTNFGLRLFHFGDASIMVLFWHFGSVGVLSAVAASLGRYFLRWHHTDVPAIK